MINGILWRLRTGAPWRDIPERYGPWQSRYERYKRWDEDGTWARLLEAMLRRRRIVAVIPERAEQQAGRRGRGRSGGRPPAFDPNTYKQRNLVERCFNKLKQFRAVATRFDQLAGRYRSGAILASLIVWLRHTALSDTA